MKALFIGRNYLTLDDGGKIVTKRNVDFLKKICEQVDEVLRPRGNMQTFLKNIILNEGYGYTYEIKKQFNALVNTNQYDFVWLDGSCDSSIAIECHKKNIPIICFYHNIETIFYNLKAINSASLKDKVFAKYIQKIEKKTSTLAKYHILLNARDASEVAERYNVECDLILPTSFSKISSNLLKTYETSDAYLLFVGSNFWANIEGLDFFFKEIAPHIKIKIRIVGGICDSFINQELPQNVSLEGKVDNLDPYYANALAVISPIISGSGTKTKTIEALRYGKTIIGSPEAMMGVPDKYYPKICKVCKSSLDYIKAINDLPNQKFNKNSYETFNELFSDDAVFNKLQYFLINKFGK